MFIKQNSTSIVKVTTVVIVAALFLPVYRYFLSNGWIGDFWLHAAAVRQFSESPWHPSHPFYDISRGDVLLSPYALCIGLVSRVLEMSAINTLAWAALFNFVLYLFAFYRFTTRFFVPPLFVNVALLCTLYLWGQESWIFSGFYHAKTLAMVLPYPSAFCHGVTLLLLSYFPMRFEKRSRLQLAFTLAVHCLVLLSHPLTYLFLFTCSVSLCFSSLYRRCELTAQFAITLCTLALVSLWPFFPFIDFLASPAPKFHLDSVSMYANVIWRVWPVIVLAPCLLQWKIAAEASRFALAIVLLAGFYVYGFISGKYIYGREIGNLMFLFQLLIASSLTVRAKQFFRSQRALVNYGVFALSLVCLMSQLSNIPSSVRYNDYSILMSKVKHGDVVLAPLEHSHFLPAFSGKVVAVSHPPSFLSDTGERMHAVGTFYDESMSEGTRLAILRQFHVCFVLLDTPSVSPSFREELGKIATSVSKTTLLEMMEVKRDICNPNSLI